MNIPGRLRYVPGDRSVLVVGGRLAVQIPSGHRRHAEALWRLTRAASGMDDLLEWLVDQGFRSFTALVAVEFGPDGPARILLRGDPNLEITDAGGSTRAISGAERRTWLDTMVSDSSKFSVGRGAVDDEMALLSGVVLMDGFRWSKGIEAGEPEPVPASSSARDVALAAPPPADVPPPAPIDPLLAGAPRVETEPMPAAGQDGRVAPGAAGSEGTADAAAAPGETWVGAALTIDPFGDATATPRPGVPEPGRADPNAASHPGRSLAGSAPIDVADLPGAHFEPVDDFDQVFGATQVRSVEGAAVRAAAEDEPQPVPHPGSPDNVPPDNVPSDDMPPDGQGDHDGHTITSAELARLQGAARVQTAPPAAGEFVSLRAAICEQGHPNPPNEAVCRNCGTSLESAVMRSVPRPVLGHLSFQDGQRVALEGMIIVGRAPRAPLTPRSQIPTLVSVQSPEHGVSRSHVEVRIEGWSASVVDLGSTNGTEVTLPGEAPRRLRRGEPCLITPGTVVNLGDEVSAVYEVGQ